MTFAELKQRFDLYEKLMRLDKPIGTLLLLWPTLWALWIATRRAAALHMLVWIFASARC
jgi:4-hydroxybenzoate polyprenyltransferase